MYKPIDVFACEIETEDTEVGELFDLYCCLLADLHCSVGYRRLCLIKNRSKGSTVKSTERDKREGEDHEVGIEQPIWMLSLRENLKLTRKILDSNALVFIVPAVISALLMEVTRLFIEPISPASKLTTELVNADLSTFQSIFGSLVVYMLIQNIFQAVVNGIGWGAITVAAYSSFEERAVSLGCMKLALASIIPLTTAVIIASELSTGYVLLVAPGILLTTLFSMTTPVLLLEDRGVFDSLKQSYILVRKSVWATFTIYSVAWIITFVADHNLL